MDDAQPPHRDSLAGWLVAAVLADRRFRYLDHRERRSGGGQAVTNAESADYHWKCQSPLQALRPLARELDHGAYVSHRMVTEVSGATSAVLDEVEAAWSAGSGHVSNSLRTRLERLTAAAERAVTVARLGNGAGLRRRLNRVEAMTPAA